MHETQVAECITATFDGVHTAGAWGDTFFYNPDRERPDEFYFATLKTQDDDNIGCACSIPVTPPSRR